MAHFVFARVFRFQIFVEILAFCDSFDVWDGVLCLCEGIWECEFVIWDGVFSAWDGEFCFGDLGIWIRECVFGLCYLYLVSSLNLRTLYFVSFSLKRIC